MSDQTYNGWTNYETWAVGMFLDGNYTGEGTYREVLVLLEGYEADDYGADRDTKVYNIAETIKDYVECEVLGDDAPSSLATDLLGAALSEVNWRELAESKLGEIVENAR